MGQFPRDRGNRLERRSHDGLGNRARAREMMQDWFRKPMRDNDEGYADINLALNALESAFIQLTGKANAKGQFFPQMRKRIAARGHKVADYEVCL